MTDLQHLKDLMSRATPGPQHADGYCVYEPRTRHEGDDGPYRCMADTNSEEYAALISALINAAPAMLAVVEAACWWRDAKFCDGVEYDNLKNAVDAWRKQS